MTPQELYDKFNELLLRNAWWQRFVNSQFIKMFAIMGGQIIYAAQTAVDKTLTEGFISLATKRTSILAAAEDRGYVAPLITPSEGTVKITNKHVDPIALTIYTTLVSDELKKYMLMEPVTLSGGETKHGIKVQQIERSRVTQVVNNQSAFQTLILSKEMTARCSRLDVYVTDNGSMRLWAENPMFRLSTKSSRHYVTFYRPTEQLGIRFGDGSIGMMPGEGESIVVDVWLSDGDITLVQGQTLTPVDDYSELAPIVEIKTETPITNGAGFEDTELTRSRAQYRVAYDEQVVWGGDYKYFLRTVIPKVSWINAWGEKEQEQADGFKSLANINTIYLCGHRPGWTQAEMEAAVLSAFKNVPNYLNTKFKYVQTNEKPFTISLEGTAVKTANLEEAKRKIMEVLETGAGRDSTSKDNNNDTQANEAGNGARVGRNALWALVEGTGLLSEFSIVINGMQDASELNDFVYLDVNNSTFALRY